MIRLIPAAVAVTLLTLAPIPAGAQTPTYLSQGWTAAERNWFYTVSQGSQMMPYKWFLALENAGDDKPFTGELTGFGYLANPKSAGNPDGLPVGFVKDVDPANRSEWVGLNCSACHTNQVNVAGHLVQIDGGPTNADMFQLIDGAAKALAAVATSTTDPKFMRFADRVLPAGHSPVDVEHLLAGLKTFSADFTRYVAASTTPVPWGRARLDAFGMIFNRVTAIDLKIDGNNMPPDAPVSYPFLWDTHWHNVVQWNGSAPNELAVERLVRNVGEVLGVFAHADIKSEPQWPNYSINTTARRANQLLIEDQLSRLRGPAWPKQWASIDAAKAQAGAKLYQANCIGCHAIVTPGKRQTVTMTPISEVRTDPKMATNAATRVTKDTGVLDGATIPPLPIIVQPIGATSPTVELVAKITVAAVLAPVPMDDVPTVVKLAQKTAHGDLKSIALGMAAQTTGANVLREAMTQTSALAEKQAGLAQELKYKARPLDGIWATAPYLHNGSVPNLWQVLLPAARRDSQFWVGSRDFDPVQVGFKTEQAPGASLFDTGKSGNSNAGHDGDAYGTSKLTDDQRWQLLEYLKTL